METPAEIQSTDVPIPPSSDIDFTHATELPLPDGCLAAATNGIDDEESDVIPSTNDHASLPALQVFDVTPENAAFHQQIALLQTQCEQLQDLLQQRETVVALQQREMTVVDREKTAARKEMEQSRREKETAVVKYAMAEKSLIDLRLANEQLTKRLKDAGKETEALAARVKFVTSERDRSNKELRRTSTECEAQKQEIFGLETKLKWSHVKIKQETDGRVAAEAKVKELSAGIGQLRDSQQQNQNQLRYEEKEIEAQLILLKHTVDSKEKECSALQTTLAQTSAELEDLTAKHSATTDELNRIRLENTAKATAIQDFEKTHEELSNLLANYSQELAQSQSAATELQSQLDTASAALDEMRDLRANHEEQTMELSRIRLKDESLMQFTKELTERSVDAENRLLLATSKAAALELENVKIRELFEEHRTVLVRMEGELKMSLDERESERQRLETVVERANAERTEMETRLDNCLGELEATKRKHSQVVKELVRDVSVLKAKIGPKAPQPDRVEDREPSKKSLIDRIAKLQRIHSRQTEKIEFLENHCAGLINQLKGKSN